MIIGQEDLQRHDHVALNATVPLLVHEARYWRRTAAATDLPENGALLKPVVAAAALLGAANLSEATDLVARVPDLADTSKAQQRPWARWLYGLYPGNIGSELGSLQPDLLAEMHVVKQLVADTDLAASCLRDLAERQAEHALTILARACAHQDQAQHLIQDALNADLAHLAIPAARVARHTRDALGMLLATALQNAPAQQDVLISMADALPYPSAALAHAHPDRLRLVPPRLRVLRAFPCR